MTEVLEKNLQCPHCGSDDVEQYVMDDTEKFHENVKEKEKVKVKVKVKEKVALIPPSPKKIRLGNFLILFTLFGIGIYEIIHHGDSHVASVLIVLLMLIGVAITLIAFFICLGYNTLRYPSAYSRWYDENINTYVCYCCGRSFSYSPADEKIEQGKNGLGDEAPK